MVLDCMYIPQYFVRSSVSGHCGYCECSDSGHTETGRTWVSSPVTVQQGGGGGGGGAVVSAACWDSCSGLCRPQGLACVLGPIIPPDG